MARELLWGLRAVTRELRAWRARAAIIPDAALRADALESLTSKRANADGAALFWTIPARRSSGLLRLLVAFEVMADFLDSVDERTTHVGIANGLQLHLALSEALDLEAPVSAYYRHHPWCGDGDYLKTLVLTCRACCKQLPSYKRVRMPAIHAATLALVLALNHEHDPGRREEALREWADRSKIDRRADADGRLAWFESTAAASGWLAIFALLTLAAEQECDESHIADTCAAYLPWISLAGTMLDSYVDQAEDAASGDHSYIAHYSDTDAAVERVGALVRRAALHALALTNGARHAVLLASMIAMYLSKDSARTPQMRASTRALAEAGGSLTRLLLPILRLWRIVYGQRAT